LCGTRIYIYIYVYDVFLFYMHVVADADDFFMLSFSQSCVVLFCSRFIITPCLTIIVFVAFLESLYCAVLYCTVLHCAVFGVKRIVCLVFLVVGESPCESLYCAVLYRNVLCCLLSQQIVYNTIHPFRTTNCHFYSVAD
jgi:hypothetical protein